MEEEFAAERFSVEWGSMGGPIPGSRLQEADRMDWVTRCQERAAEEGHGEHWWIYSLWDMKRESPHK